MTKANKRRDSFDEHELTEQQFKQRLRDAGWTEPEIEQEWIDIQNDEESGE